MRAYADESSGHIGDNFAYVMCAALINKDNMEPCRQVLRRFRKGSANLNWIRQSTGAYIWLQHERGAGEPLLWAADLICGASFARLRGTDSYNEALDRLHIWHS